jgi:hypothetical protein
VVADHNSLGYLVARSKSMSLRDYLAAAALQGLIGRMHDETMQNAAKLAYQFADDMLEARK